MTRQTSGVVVDLLKVLWWQIDLETFITKCALWLLPILSKTEPHWLLRGSFQWWEGTWTMVKQSCLYPVRQLNISPGHKESKKSPGGFLVTTAPDDIQASSLTNGRSQDCIYLALLLALEATIVFNFPIVLQDSFWLGIEQYLAVSSWKFWMNTEAINGVLCRDTEMFHRSQLLW